MKRARALYRTWFGPTRADRRMTWLLVGTVAWCWPFMLGATIAERMRKR